MSGNCFPRGRGRGRRHTIETVQVGKPLLEAEKENGKNEVVTRKDINSAVDQEPQGSIKSGITAEKSEFWQEHQKLQVYPPIPYESNQVLEEADVQFSVEQFFGDNEPCSKPLFTKPVLPTRIVLRDDGRYFLETSGPVKLPKNIQLNTRLLCIDDEDILYLRCHEEDQPECKQKIGTLQKLLSCMDTYYSKFDNQVDTYVGKDGWIPDVGEVVVVKIKRILATDHSTGRFFSRTEYQRAVVKALKLDHINVELVDDYGIGGIQFSNTFKIAHQFIVLPCQVFHCELAEMGIINDRKLVHSVIRLCGIEKIWPDCQMNYVGTTWLGEESKDGRPLVEILIQLKSMSLDKYVPLKTHVYRNLQSVVSPFIHLVENNGLCRVFDADQHGFLWVRFIADDELYSGVRSILDKLIPHYANLLQYCRLTVNMLAPGRNLPRLKRNMKKLYAVLLPEHEKQDSKKLYRVKVKSVNSHTQTAKVYCIDDHVCHEVHVCGLVPLFNLYPDLTYFSPLILKVHLHRIKSLNTNADPVKNTLFGEVIKMTLVHEWPMNAYPPEVSICSPSTVPQPAEDQNTEANLFSESTTDVPDAVNSTDMLHFAGFCKYFIDIGCAEMLKAGEMTILYKKIVKLAAKLKEKEASDEGKKIFEDEKNVELKERLACHTFSGENFSFLLDKCEALDITAPPNTWES